MEPANGVVTGMRERLGEILLRKGRLDRPRLREALIEAGVAGERLGTHLVNNKVVYEEDVSVALAEQFGLRYVVVDPRELDPAVASLLPEAVARRLNALPLSGRHDLIRVAIAVPTDVLLVDELRMVVDTPVDFVVTDASMIRAGLDRLYPPLGVARTEPDDEPRHGEGELEQSLIDSGQDNAPAVEEVNRLLRHAIDLGASDLHFVPHRNDLHVRARVDGVMRDVSVVPRLLRNAVIARLKVMARLDIAERRLPQDGRVSISVNGVDMDLRVAVLPSTRGEQVVLRIAYIGQGGLRTIDDLGLDTQTFTVLRHSLRKPGGAIIVAGPTGTGKTTTLYAALGELNDGARTLVSIEDPVETLVDGVVQVEVKPVAGLTFARGLRTILRADPDVILVGEIRDLETAEIVLHAAMTGHVVLSTIHAQSAAAGLVRLRDLGVPEASLGSAVHTVISQRLLRRPCPRCHEGESITQEDLERVKMRTDAVLFRPAGCVECDFTGYSGRVAIYEALTVNAGTRDLLAGPTASIEAAAVARGMTPLYEQARRLCEAGGTTVDEVIRVLGESD
jgi:type IV pilus assembly protein PilB